MPDTRAVLAVRAIVVRMRGLLALMLVCGCGGAVEGSTDAASPAAEDVSVVDSGHPATDTADTFVEDTSADGSVEDTSVEDVTVEDVTIDTSVDDTLPADTYSPKDSEVVDSAPPDAATCATPTSGVPAGCTVTPPKDYCGPDSYTIYCLWTGGYEPRPAMDLGCTATSCCGTGRRLHCCPCLH